MKLIILLCLTAFSIAHSTVVKQCDDLKLELVQVLLRHGARTPIDGELNVSNYKAISAYEPWGLGELNKQGKQQAFVLGRFLRNRYANFLGSIYKPKDLYAYSSDLSRTKMSLELVLAGLYPSGAQTRWHNYLNWSPIPYSSAPTEIDILLRANDKPKFSKLVIGVLESTEFKKRLAKYNDFFNYVAENTRANNNSGLANAARTFDILISNEYMNLPLPNWYTQKVRKTFIEIMELTFDAWAYTTELKKLISGFLIKTFIENMNLNGTTHNPRKIYLYSGHDTNIASFTRSHNIKEFRFPSYGSALIFEKLKNSRGQVYVRLFAWDGLGQLIPLKFNENEKCLIDDYLEIVKPLIPSAMEVDDMIGSLNTTQIKNLLFNSAPKPATTSFTA